MKIKFTKGTSYKNLSASESKVVGRELKQIQGQYSVITPKVVVDQARDKKSPLHKYFEWNDGAAAEKYRESQARHLILSVFIVDSDSEDANPVRAFVNVSPSDDEDSEFVSERGYVYTPSIGNKQAYKNQVLQYARNQILNWRKRFGHYSEFLSVCAEIDKL